jgi:hypothetical protein
VFLAAGSFDTVSWTIHTGNVGQGYATKHWKSSPTIKAISQAPPDLPMYTEGYDVVYLLTGRVINQLPKMPPEAIATTNPVIENEIQQMIERLRATGGWIVYFDRIDRTEYLLNQTELRKRAKVIQVKKVQVTDGRIFRLPPDRQASPDSELDTATRPNEN